ncbi:DUF3306 domain-containing protein [Hydrogenophaga laconesensis]|uniref:DUF3306 domain-containing protein n=1 Tax=Hydrogenophaga laconesensis TaxID=1805971 RepID=A0ABU1VAT4_9BURK|nr:DUF3306 domain-containing protein [Hydrogenophaga laconesensis]MDR7094562.1 hypothetical protein [Hydrogenophaga laconesensis]
MAAEDDSNFFSRWSRRKVQVRTGEAVPPEPPARPAMPVAAPAPAPAPAAPSGPAPQPSEAAESPPALTLEDVARLTPESDYSGFVARGVPSDVRNAAMKKLFTDPHYNVMDGLDIYIDDYSKPSPLLAAEVAKMVGARFLKLVDDPDEVRPPEVNAPQAAASDPSPEPIGGPSHPDATADACEPLASASPDSHDDHPDLQLQPDDAAEPPGSGRRAG